MDNTPQHSRAGQIRCVAVWPGWLRGCHWIIAGGVLFEFVSAWALLHDDGQRAFWHDWHLIVGQIMLLALLVRFALLLRPGVGHWRSLLPDRSQLSAIGQTLKSYLSLGRSPLPHWYAHNPLWKPLYLVMFVLLLGGALSGLDAASASPLLDADAAVLHTRLAELSGGLVLLHIATAVLHDLKGEGGMVSAMINGRRYFHVPQQSAGPIDPATYVSVDTLRKSPPDTDPLERTETR